MEFVGSSYSTDNHTDGGGVSRLWIPAPSGIQEGDFCVAVYLVNSGASGGPGSGLFGHSQAYDVADTILTDDTKVETVDDVYVGQNSGGDAIPIIDHCAIMLGPTMPSYWRCSYRDPAVTNDRNLIGFVMAFRGFVPDPTDSYGGGFDGSVVGPTTGNITPATGTRTDDSDAVARISVTGTWATWSTTNTIPTVGTPPAVDTYDSTIGRAITSPVTVRRAIAGSYSILAAGDATQADDTLVWTRTDQTSMRGRSVTVIYQGTAVAADSVPGSARVELPRTRMDLTVFPNKLTQASLHELR